MSVFNKVFTFKMIVLYKNKQKIRKVFTGASRLSEKGVATNFSSKRGTRTKQFGDKSQ